jgi:hypothetical protein
MSGMPAGGDVDSDCMLGRMGLQQEVLLARQLHAYPHVLPSSGTEGSFEWVSKTGNIRVNLLKSKTNSFNIQKFCVLPKMHLYKYVLCGSQNKQRLFLYTALTYRF